MTGIGLAAGLAAAPAAVAATTIYHGTGSRIYATDQAGYAATGAAFQTASATVYLRAPGQYTKVDDGISWETHLYGTDTKTGKKWEIDLGAGGDPASLTGGNYNVWALTADDTAQIPGASSTWNGAAAAGNQQPGAFPPGDTVTESIHYARASGFVFWRVSDAAANLFSGRAYLGSNVTFGETSVIGGFDPGSSFAPPPAPLRLATFTGIRLTSASGHQAGFASWWTHSKIVATSDGTSAGTVRATPADLPGGGTSFSVSFVP
ncbi:MAG TPA: hypothetical protein VMH35_06185 [Streptosporangiaceae bacterium]|nr:hypothetical protein [Streptosporangiaceae bacterium]